MCELVIFNVTLYEPLVTLLLTSIYFIRLCFMEEHAFFWPCHFCCCIAWPGIIHIWSSCDLVISAATLFDPFVTLLFLLLIKLTFFCCSLYVLIFATHCMNLISAAHFMTFFWPYHFAAQCMTFKPCYFNSAAYYMTSLTLLFQSAATRMTSIN